MKKLVRTVALALGVGFMQLGAVEAQVNFPGGRIAMSFDGNSNDADDYGAMPLSIAMVAKAGLSSKLVHVEHGNNICENSAARSNKMNSLAEQALQRFGPFSNAKEYQIMKNAAERSSASSNLAAEINASTATNPLWIIAAGPMHTVAEGIRKAQQAKRQHVIVVSHSDWNQKYDRCNNHTSWTEMKNEFSGQGILFIETSGTSVNAGAINKLADQNKSNGDNDFNAPKSKWSWLQNSSDANERWLFTNNTKSSYDVSDAGMTYFVISGGVNLARTQKQGCETCGTNQTKSLFDNAARTVAVPEEAVAQAAEAAFPGGRIAMSFDGNIEDDDDIVALPVSLAIAKAAGVQNKVVHVEYNNNTCGGPNTVQQDNNDTPAFAGNDANHMIASANGMVNRYGYNAGIMYDYTREGNAARTHLAAEINASTGANPLYIVAGGPMETVWRALNASDASKHANVYVISHSKWNQNYARCAASSHDWADLKRDFPGVVFIESGGGANQLPDQNGNLNTPIANWNWMKNSADANLRWMFTRNPFSGKFDPSDAGMVYFVVTGGPRNGGTKRPTVGDVQRLLTGGGARFGATETAVLPFTMPAPNPFTDAFEFQVEEDVQKLTLIDMKGAIQKVSFVKSNHQSYQVQAAHLPAGVYMLNVTTPSATRTYRLVKTN